MKRHSKPPVRRARSVLRVLAASLTIGFLGMGCDALDPSLLLPDRSATPGTDPGIATPIAEDDSQPATTAAPPVVLPAKHRAPDMESIGPEASRRVYYQFIDDRGHVQFVERLTDVPEAWRNRVGHVELSQPPPLTPLEARRTWKVSAGRTAEILLARSTESRSAPFRSRRNADVILYYATWCGYCTKARKHLDREGVDYELRDIDKKSIARELREKTGRGGVPVLEFDGKIVRGYSKDRYDEAIREIQN